MGTATFDITKYGKNRGSAAGTVAGALVTSGAHTTSTTVSSLTDGAAGSGSAINAAVGTVLRIVGTEAMRVSFGGVDATASLGHYLEPDVARDIEIPAAGTIRIIDVL